MQVAVKDTYYDKEYHFVIKVTVSADKVGTLTPQAVSAIASELKMVQSVADTISLVIVAGIEEAMKPKKKQIDFMLNDSSNHNDADIVGPDDIDFGIEFNDGSPRQENDINFESARSG